ncbi:hypothetical protein [Fischerella thermalis]|nr:hypothetical protein [Fischerella thermalis]
MQYEFLFSLSENTLLAFLASWQYITSSPYCTTSKAGLAIAKGQMYFLQK